MCNSIPNPSPAPAPRSYHLLTTLSPIRGHKLLGTLYPYRTRICCCEDGNSLFSPKLTSLPTPAQAHHWHLQTACSKSPNDNTTDTSNDISKAMPHRERNQRGKALTFRTSIDKKVARGALCAPATMVLLPACLLHTWNQTA